MEGGKVSEVAGGDWERNETWVPGRRRSEVEGQARRWISEEVPRSKGHCFWIWVNGLCSDSAGEL